MKRLMTFNNTLFALLAGLLVLLPIWAASVTAAPIKQESGQSCRYFTETAGGAGGFSVTNDDNVRFLTAFNQWGLTKIGFPISGRYVRDGFVTQAFQKGIMQWQPESEAVALINIFDELHDAGFDGVLFSTRQTPTQLPAGWDGDISFDEVVQKRQALLDERPALRDAYFASNDPLTFFGLPTSPVEDMGSHYAIRLQRTVLQEWKENVPWAAVGDVTIANGADIAKELGGLPEDALTPLAESPCSEAAAEAPPAEEETPEPVEEETPEPVEEETPEPVEEETPEPVEEETPEPVEEETPEPVEEETPEPVEEEEEEEVEEEEEEEEEVPPPAIEPTQVPPPASHLCPADPALLEVSNGLGEPLTINITGPQNALITLPARTTVRYCITAGNYGFNTESASYQGLSGYKTFSSDKCQCWDLYTFDDSACSCSDDILDYGPLQ